MQTFHPEVSTKNSIATALALCSALLLTGAPMQAAAQGGWGTYQKPFAATSPWNSRPVQPVLGDFVIPKSTYSPGVAGGEWSTGVFLAKAGDQPVTVSGLPKTQGLWDPDASAFHDVTIPRWPVDVVAASASDGHADIVDPAVSYTHLTLPTKRIV